MEKISGIIPSSARVTSVDLKSSGTVRPGQPSFGRPVGRSAPAIREFSTTDRAMSAMDQLGRAKPAPMDPHTKIVHDMAEGFFMKKSRKPVEVDLNDPQFQVESPQVTVDDSVLMAGIEQSDPVTVDLALEAVNVAQSSETQDESDLDRPLTGAYLDVRV